jgi:hypothetical protein
MDEARSYYRVRREGMIKSYQAGEEVSREILARFCGEAEASVLWRRTMELFSGIYEDLPYIGGDENHLTWNLSGAAFGLAFYLAMKEQKRSTEEAGRILYLMMREFVIYQAGTDQAPAPSPERIREEREGMRASCAMTQKKEFPGNWISSFVDVDPASFDYGWDNTACGILTLLERYGAKEFLPYLCMLDQIIYPTRGLGLTRTQTLAEGDRCDFRVTAGGPMKLLEPMSARCLKEWGITKGR